MTRKSLIFLFTFTFLVIAMAANVSAHHRPGHGGGGNPPTATPEPTATPTPCTTCPKMFVEVVNVNAWSQSKKVGGGCLVRIRDEANNKVDGALVSIQWSGIVSGSASGLTEPRGDGDIYAQILADTVNHRCNRNGPAIFTCTVTSVSKDGLAYDPTMNLETTDSDDACGPCWFGTSAGIRSVGWKRWHRRSAVTFVWRCYCGWWPCAGGGED